jgi:putative ABC transport system substrate-binding protein
MRSRTITTVTMAPTKRLTPSCRLFPQMVCMPSLALLVGSDPFFFWQRDHVTGLAARHRIPAIYDLREFAQTGGLMSYGNSMRGRPDSGGRKGQSSGLGWSGS